MKHGILSFAVAVALIAGPAAAEPITGTCVEVVDGDTIVVEVDGQRRTLELAEIDAPELDQAFGPEARDLLASLVLDREVRFLPREEAAGGVTVARVRVGGTKVDLELVRAGLAWTPDTSDEELAVATIMARSQQQGLWSDPRPVPPWVWLTREPPPPTPTPGVVVRSLSEAGKVVDLKKNEGNRAVIAGLPQKTGDGDEGEGGDDAAAGGGGIEVKFTCHPVGIETCLEENFRSGFARAYPGDTPGSYTLNGLSQEDGSLTAKFQGQSMIGASYTVGVACTCGDDSCACVMGFGAIQTVEEEAEPAGD